MRTESSKGFRIGAVGLAAVALAVGVVLLTGQTERGQGVGDATMSREVVTNSGTPPMPEAVAAYERAQSHVQEDNFPELIVAFELLSEAVRISPGYREAGRQLWEVAWTLEQRHGYQAPNPELYW